MDSPTPPMVAQPETETKTSLAARLLTAAVKAWLRSQLDYISDLNLHIHSGNRQLLTGTIPKIDLSAHQAVYQGLHLQDLNVIAQQIRVNLRQILQGKPFRLLEPVPIDLNVTLTNTGLQASLGAPLLQAAFTDLLTELFADQLPFPVNVTAIQLTLNADHVRLIFPPVATDTHHPIHLQTGVTIGQPNELVLSQPQWWIADPHIDTPERYTLSDYCFNLGAQAHLQTLTLNASALNLSGRLQIMP